MAHRRVRPSLPERLLRHGCPLPISARSSSPLPFETPSLAPRVLGGCPQTSIISAGAKQLVKQKRRIRAPVPLCARSYHEVITPSWVRMRSRPASRHLTLPRAHSGEPRIGGRGCHSPRSISSCASRFRSIRRSHAQRGSTSERFRYPIRPLDHVDEGLLEVVPKLAAAMRGPHAHRAVPWQDHKLGSAAVLAEVRPERSSARPMLPRSQPSER